MVFTRLGVMIVGAFAIVVLVGGFAHSRNAPFSRTSPALPVEEKWRDEIEKRGAVGAYEELAKIVEDKSVNEKHKEAHAFGAALFASEGAGGLSVCDSRFSFGCFHEFLGTAIPALGIGSIHELNDACYADLTESPLSCQHGIGHGVLAAYGYDDVALRDSLEACRSLKQKDPIGGCYGGVFMEYNVRTMLGDEGHLRAFTGNRFDPCDALDDAFVPACIYWLPQWWIEIEPADIPHRRDRFTKFGEYCREFASEPETRRACFEGLGNIVADYSNFDPVAAHSYCKAAGTQPAERLLCIGIGANHFGLSVSAEAAAQMCENLTGEELSYCSAYARNEANVAFTRPLPL
ncbi:MAG: hypothetical protein WA021_03395 [Minisyncoccia bacterium]